MFTEDMFDKSRELLRNLLQKGAVIKHDNKWVLDFQGAEMVIAIYLMDAYNDGYDKAIVSGGTKRNIQ